MRAGLLTPDSLGVALGDRRQIETWGEDLPQEDFTAGEGLDLPSNLDEGHHQVL